MGQRVRLSLTSLKETTLSCRIRIHIVYLLYGDLLDPLGVALLLALRRWFFDPRVEVPDNVLVVQLSQRFDLSQHTVAFLRPKNEMVFIGFVIYRPV